jgi:DNA polymerase elongation subunit (family B)
MVLEQPKLKLLSSLSDSELKEYQKRLEYDISKYSIIEQATKKTLVSAFGTLGCSYFRYFDVRLAEAITLSGQLVIKWIANELNVFLNDVLKTTDVDFMLGGDTDSVFISLEKLVDKVFDEEKQKDIPKVIKFLDKTCKEVIEPQIQKICEQFYDYLNVSEKSIQLKCEALADKGLWTAKKRYILNIYAKEAIIFDEPKLKIKGLEAIKSSTPQICRKQIKECLKLIMRKTEKDVIDFISEFKKEFEQSKPEEVAFPRSVNNLKKYSDASSVYIKATPIHVKGSLLYNHFLKEKKLTKKYELIREGEKIKFVYLKEPNFLHSPVIAFPDVLPEEFQAHQFIDYETQFNKTFIEPIKLVLDVIGWSSVKKERTLFDML